MTCPVTEDTQDGMRYLRLLAKIESGEMVWAWNDIEGDDSEGRITGQYVCGICGMRSFDPDHPETCCKPDFEAAGINPNREAQKWTSPTSDEEQPFENSMMLILRSMDSF